MNGRIAKKLHKEAKKLAKADWFEYQCDYGMAVYGSVEICLVYSRAVA